ncbi:hypothetical protein ElyMa_004107000 [Elysia marginata]|uniref:Uncharacterized protein n=1 Tax=Elysia marginata TaxID=1093978 RepID=A0AAV4GC14_9GAST|nr:hypothetical protein ElyMa_004107000 [Elysia marginata]
MVQLVTVPSSLAPRSCSMRSGHNPAHRLDCRVKPGDGSRRVSNPRETRFAEEGQLRELGAGYTLFSSGRVKEDRRKAVVGFAVKNALFKKPSVCEELADSLDEKSKHIEITGNTEETWSRFRDTVYAAAGESLGPNKRKHQDWFDENNEEIIRMLEEKNRLFRAYFNDKSPSRKAALDNISNTVQRKLRENAVCLA